MSILSIAAIILGVVVISLNIYIMFDDKCEADAKAAALQSGDTKESDA